jgi:hypothetical protein
MPKLRGGNQDEHRSDTTVHLDNLICALNSRASADQTLRVPALCLPLRGGGRRRSRGGYSQSLSAAVCARRTLEGIFKHLVEADKRDTTLVSLIEHAKRDMDLAAPLTSLSYAIRDGGNLGAHFDTEKEPDETLARQMVELLQYLISYLYVLPKEIRKLEQNLGKNA